MIFVVGINGTNKKNEVRVVRINAKTGGIENINRISVDLNLDENSLVFIAFFYS